MAPPDDAERECMACRGTGSVARGDRPEPEPCPWCEGSGRFIPGHDAQARWTGREGGGDPAPPEDAA